MGSCCLIEVRSGNVNFDLGWVGLGWVGGLVLYSRGDEYVHVEVEACVNSVVSGF